MNPNYTQFRFPQIKAHPWSRVFSRSVPADAIDLLVLLLKYDPLQRVSATEGMAHPFFDPLRANNGRGTGDDGPNYCDWQPGELDGVDEVTRRKLQPIP